MLKNMVDVDARISTSFKNILRATAIGLFLTVSTPAISQNTSSASAASAYPTKPIRVVVPSPPGGPPDLIMRMLAPKLSASLGQSIIVENRNFLRMVIRGCLQPHRTRIFLLLTRT